MKLTPKTQTLPLFCRVLFLLCALFLSCGEQEVPKPKAYLRISLPEKEYQKSKFENSPFSFEYPVYADIITNKNDMNRSNFKLDFKNQNAILLASYQPIHSSEDLFRHIDSSYNVMFKIHAQKSTGISERAYDDSLNQVYATLYMINGSQVASPCQFYITDKKKHFLRASLYFNHNPNNDSIAPILEFVKQDIEHLISTFRWEK